MNQPYTIRRVVIAAAALAALAGESAAAPGDIYYRVHVGQHFQYYAFAGDQVTWEDSWHEGTDLSLLVDRDSSMTSGLVGAYIALTADAGSLVLDLEASINEAHRVGVYHIVTDTATVEIYVRGPTGTPCWMSGTATGEAFASRLGGMPGSLAPLNGTSIGDFLIARALMDSTGTIAVPVDSNLAWSGTTTTERILGGETYSLARAFIFHTRAWIRQAVCILGCMTAAATFDARGTGHVELRVSPYTDPTAVADADDRAATLRVRAAPNPARGATTVAFRAAAGRPVELAVFDVRGRRVGTLFDGIGTGADHHVTWRASGLSEGLYFVRMRSGAEVATAKVAVLR